MIEIVKFLLFFSFFSLLKNVAAAGEDGRGRGGPVALVGGGVGHVELGDDVDHALQVARRALED